MMMVCSQIESVLNCFGLEFTIIVNMSYLTLADSDSSLLGKSIKFFRSSFLEPLLKSCKVNIPFLYFYPRFLNCA